MTTACVVGSTGLVGANILSTILTLPSFNKIYAYTRKDLTQDSKLTPLKSSDSTTWSSIYPTNDNVEVFFSGLGTTRAIAGGFEKQRKIDYDLNLELAKAAKAAGTKTYVLISSHGSNSKSMMGYPKMKGELEDAVQKLDFDHCIIVRPGLILGQRDHLRLAEASIQTVARVVGSLHIKLQESWAVDAAVIANAAVQAALNVAEGKNKEKVWIVDHSEIIRLGRTEWKS